MKRILLAGAAALATATLLVAPAPDPALAQPAPAPTPTPPPNRFQQEMQRQQQLAAEREAAQRAQAERDLARMTPEQRERYRTFVRERVEQAFAGQNLTGMGRELQRDFERNIGNLELTVGGNDAFVNDPLRVLSDRQWARDVAHGGVQGINTMLQTGRDVLLTVRPAVLILGPALADITRARQEALLASNPNMSERERDVLRYETQSGINAANHLEQRLDEYDFRTRTTQQQISEAEQRIADAMEQMATEQGRDVSNWDFTRGPRPRRYSVTPREIPGTGIPNPDGWGFPEPPPAPEPEVQPQPQPIPGGRRPVRRGTVPGGDPYEGLYVPREQGGTGGSYVDPSLPPDPNARPDPNGVLTPEQRAARTEMLRRQAMERARAENERLERIWRGERDPNERVDDFEFREPRGIPLEIRPIGGGSGASGGGSYAEQMAGGSGMPDGEYWSVEDFGYGEVDGDPVGEFSPTEAFLWDDGGTFEPYEDAWQSFELGGIITIADLVPIYDGYDWLNAPVGSSGRSLSSAGTSLSSAGTSLSSAGTSLSAAGSITPSSAPTGMRVDWAGFNLSADPLRVSNGGRPEPGSYADMLRQINGPGPSNLATNPWTDAPWATSNRDLARALYGPLWSDRPYQVQADPYGRRGRSMGGPELANLYDTDLDIFLRLLGSDFAYLRGIIASDRGGLDRLLAQPFNVLLTWGPDAFDLDLHMTGPLETASDRFHIYYAARGQLAAQPFAELIRDCVCASGSEVILTSTLNQGSGVYRVSVFNFGDQSATSTNLSGESGAVLQIVRGGVAVPVGNGTTIEGGVPLLTLGVPTSGAGNTWVAAEINPNNGTITAPNVIVQSGGSASVN